MKFKYETHAHTAEGSKCARISARDLVRHYRKLGYAGICITDHFVNGNSTVPKELPWREQIERFCRGYEEARREGEKIGLQVFLGWEYFYRGADFLTYGLDKRWLLRNPDLLKLNVNEYLDYVRLCGGFVVHAHPFREDSYIPMIHLLPRKVDAVEIVNTSRPSFENDRAREYAGNYGLLITGGSDNHSGAVRCYGGIQLERKLESIEELISAIKTGEAEVFVEDGEA